MSTNHRAHENKTAEAADNIPLRLKSLLSCLPGQKRVKSRAKSEKTPLGDIDWTWNGVTRDMCVKHQRIPKGLIAEMDFPCLSQTTSELNPHQRPHMQRTESHTAEQNTRLFARMVPLLLTAHCRLHGRWRCVIKKWGTFMGALKKKNKNLDAKRSQWRISAVFRGEDALLTALEKKRTRTSRHTFYHKWWGPMCLRSPSHSRSITNVFEFRSD